MVTNTRPGISGNTEIEMLGSVSQVNCVLESLVFQGFQNENEFIQLTRYGFQSRVNIVISPNCDAVQNPGCGQEFASSFSAVSIAVIAAVNDPPFLTTCPRSFLKATGAVNIGGLQVSNGSISWSNPVGQCRTVNLFPASDSPMIGNIPIPISLVQPYASGPAFCQVDSASQISPPFCASTNQTVCLSDIRSFVYHIEDLINATLVLQGLRVWDVDIYTGDLALDVSVRFLSNFETTPTLHGYIPLHRFDICISFPLNCQTSNFPAVVFSGSIDYYCARPKTSHGPEVTIDCVKNKNCANCARSQFEVMGSLPFLNTNPGLRINLSSFVLGSNPVQNRYFQYDMKYVITEHASDTTLENGTLSLSFSCLNSTCSETQGSFTVQGLMTAEVGFSVTSAGTKFDWYSASPMNVNGTYIYDQTSDSSPLFQVTVISYAVPIYNAAVTASFGNISIPSNQMPLLDNSAQSKGFNGRIDEINLALSEIEYRIPGPVMPFINTMSSVDARYGDVQCDLKIVVDDYGYLTTALDPTTMSLLGTPVTSSGEAYQIAEVTTPSTFSFNAMVCARDQVHVSQCA